MERIAVVDDGLAQRAGRALDLQVRVQVVLGEAGPAAPRQAPGVVGRPAAVLHEAAAIHGGARHAEAVHVARARSPRGSRRQLGADALVGIERKEPVAGGQVDAAVVLRPVAGPVGELTTVAPSARASSGVPSVLPESITITSSAKRAERTHSAILMASFLATMMMLSLVMGSVAKLPRPTA